MEKHRIGLLDSFRFIAVTIVVLYHLTNPLTIGSHDAGLTFPVFRYGYLGVEFFFIISGFVISYSLENTATIGVFFLHRFKRLFPAMLLYSLITFAVVCWLDIAHFFRNAHYSRNLLPGFTFINPAIWSNLTGIDFHWINGSYWSLWTEVQFYFISACVYFLNKKRFFTNMLLAGIIISIVKDVPGILINDHNELVSKYGLIQFFKSWQYCSELFNLTFYITWFMCGVIFYQLYKGIVFKGNIFRIAGSIAILYLLYYDIHTYFNSLLWGMLAGTVVMLVLFLLLIYKKQYLQFLNNKLLRRIGVISYGIYLIHEEIGILLMRLYGPYMGKWITLAPYIVLILMIIVAELGYRYVERKVNYFTRKRPSPLAPEAKIA